MSDGSIFAQRSLLLQKHLYLLEYASVVVDYGIVLGSGMPQPLRFGNFGLINLLF